MFLKNTKSTRVSRTFPIVFGAVVGVGALLASSATGWSQNLAGEAVRVRAADIKINPNAIEVIRRQPKTFIPFELTDPATRKPLRNPDTGKDATPSDKITLPNGKTLTLGEFYEQANSLERDFNKLGYSLREQEANPKPVVIQRSKIETSRIRVSLPANRLGVVPRTIRPSERITLSMDKVAQALTTRNTTLLKETVPMVDIAQVNPPTPYSGNPQPKQYTQSDPWNWEIGSHDTLGAYIQSQLDRTAGANKISVRQETKAGCYILGANAELVRGSWELTGANGTLNANISAAVLGKTVYTFNKSTSSKWSTSDEKSYPVEYSTKFYFSVGPIPCSATIGAQGIAGIRYKAELATSKGDLSASGKVEPFVSSKAFAQAGVDIIIAEAGVGVNLVMLDDTLTVEGVVYVGPQWSSKPNWFMMDSFKCYNTVHALDGNLYIYAKAYYPCIKTKKVFGVPIPYPAACSASFNYDIWSWGGLSNESEIFSVFKMQDLKVPYNG